MRGRQAARQAARVIRLSQEFDDIFSHGSRCAHATPQLLQDPLKFLLRNLPPPQTLLTDDVAHGGAVIMALAALQAQQHKLFAFTKMRQTIFISNFAATKRRFLSLLTFPLVKVERVFVGDKSDN